MRFRFSAVNQLRWGSLRVKWRAKGDGRGVNGKRTKSGISQPSSPHILRRPNPERFIKPQDNHRHHIGVTDRHQTQLTYVDGTVRRRSRDQIEESQQTVIVAVRWRGQGDWLSPKLCTSHRKRNASLMTPEWVRARRVQGKNETTNGGV